MKTRGPVTFLLVTAVAAHAQDDYFDLVRQARAKNEATEWSEAAKR
jgi:hypothetical protein